MAGSTGFSSHPAWLSRFAPISDPFRMKSPRFSERLGSVIGCGVTCRLPALSARAIEIQEIAECGMCLSVLRAGGHGLRPVSVFCR